MADLALDVALLTLGVFAWKPEWFQSSNDTRTASVGEAYTAVMYVANLDDPADANRHGSMLARLLTTGLSAGGGLEMLSQQRLYDVAMVTGSVVLGLCYLWARAKGHVGVFCDISDLVVHLPERALFRVNFALFAAESACCMLWV